MKRIIPAVLLFIGATTVQAQEPAKNIAATEPAPIVRPAPAKWTKTPALDPAPAPVNDATTTQASSRSHVRVDAAPKPVSVVRAQPANFWWLVGAVVLGGIILAVIL